MDLFEKTTGKTNYWCPRCQWFIYRTIGNDRCCYCHEPMESSEDGLAAWRKSQGIAEPNRGPSDG